jgi:DNA-binding NtrC family response regulator
LIEYFLKRLDGSHGTKKTLDPGVLQVLLQYAWPGNVRQLESVIERAYVMCEGDVIDIDHVPEEVKQGGAPSASLEKLRSSIDYLIDAKLTAAEYRLYLYLAKLDPLDEKFHEQLEPKEVIERLGINRDTFFVGVGKLRDLGLFDYKAKAGQGKHASHVKHPKKVHSEISD